MLKKVLFISFLFTLNVSAVKEFEITELGTFGGNLSGARGINNLGQVVGCSEGPGGTWDLRVFLYDGNTMNDLGNLPGHNQTYGNSINDKGQIVGGSRQRSGPYRGFLYDNGVFIDLGDLGVNTTDARDINEKGQITGVTNVPGYGPVGFLYEDGIMTGIKGIKGATGINDKTEIVGDWFDGAGVNKAVLNKINEGIVIDLGSLGGNWSAASAINEYSHVVGGSKTSNGETHAYLYKNGVMIDLGTLGGNFSWAFDINDNGQIVGNSTLQNGESRAFLYENGEMINLGTLPDGNYSSANGINNKGQIVGSVQVPIDGMSGFYYRAVLWEPVSTNNQPIANAGENTAISSSDISITVIQGIATDEDPDDILQYRWLEGETVLLDWIPVGENGECPLDLSNTGLTVGTHTLTLEATDGKATSSDELILIIDNSAPNVIATGSGIYEIYTDITLGGEVSDFDGDLLNCEWKIGDEIIYQDLIQAIVGGAPVALTSFVINDLELGIHTISLIVNDDINDPVSSDISFEIVDNTQPTLSPTANKNILWPPNHEMVDIAIVSNANDNSGFVTVSASITSNEPQDGLGDGDQAPDWTETIIDQNTGIITFQLRSERSGSGDGRIYTIVVTATDDSENSSSANVNILVPHDKRKK